MNSTIPVCILFGAIFTLLVACAEDDAPTEPMLHVRVVFDNDQQRLDNLGDPATIPPGHAAQTPSFQQLGIHSLELLRDAFVLPGEGAEVFTGAVTDAGGPSAIDFDQQVLTDGDEVVVSVPLADVPAGTYRYTRSSIGYQNYDVRFRYTDPVLGPLDLSGRLANFLGFNTYITSFEVDVESVTVNDDRLQGYWAFEASYGGVTTVETGQAPATTVVNPLADTSPIPVGSCLVTGVFEEPLLLTGAEAEDITVTLSVSINESFEWEDVTPDGHWEPLAGEDPVDMGLRGIEATWE